MCLLLAVPPAGAGGRARPERKPTASELKRQANQAAARYSRARAVYERLNNEIARLERKVGELRSQMRPLREAVTKRAVAVYMGPRGFEALANLSRQSDPVQSARGVRIVSQASARDLAAIEALAASAAELRDRQEALDVRKEQQQAALDRLEGERRDVELKLAIMARQGQELQARLLRERPQRASRSQRAAPAPAPAPVAAPGVDPASIPVATNFICPIAGPVAYSDSWGDARGGGRRHKGTDLMNPHGTPNVAVVSGSIERHNSGAGGLSIYLRGDDGHTYFYAHLSEVVGPDRRVAQGEVIARTGNSGNARGGSPHTHFEIHPNGGPAVNPYPTIAAHC
jgi:murein DD-endopeptidase MepM/ murein hydrolase activator NlpD